MSISIASRTRRHDAPILLSLAALPFTTLSCGRQSSATASSGTTPGVTPDTPFGRQRNDVLRAATIRALHGLTVNTPSDGACSKTS